MSIYFDYDEWDLSKISDKLFYLMLSLVVKQIGSHQCWALNITRLWNIDSLFMHFCDSNQEVARMQQEKQQQHQRAKINFMLIKIQNISLQI